MPENEVDEKVVAAIDADDAEATNEGQAMATILNAVKENPALMEDPEIANVLNLADGKPKTEDKKATKEKAEEVTEKTSDSAEKTSDSAEKTIEEEVKNLFSQKKDEPEEDAISDIEGHIKEKYSIEDVDKFFSSVDKWRNSAQDTTSLQSKIDDIENAFTEMPEPLFNAFTAWSNGNDWQEQISGVNGLDYGANFSDYELPEIVQYYFPDEFEADDFEDYSDDPTVKRAVNLAKQQFAGEKKDFENQRAEYANRAESTAKVLKESATSSVENLKEVFPGFGKSELKKVKDTLVSGNLSGVFFNKDGSYSNDAAIKLALALYGRDEIGKATSRTKESQEALKSTVNKGASKPSVKSTQSQQTQVPEDVAGIFKDVFVKNYY